MMLKKIVVGVDGREGGRDALRLAAALSELTGGELLAVSVFPYSPRPALASAPGVERERESRHAMLAEELSARGLAGRTQVIGDTSPARALHRVAEEEGADLIVVGSTHRGALGRVLVGDAAVGTLHGSPCPVAVAPRGLDAHGTPALRTIGVGYDGQEESRHALAFAAALAKQAGARLELLHVVTTPTAFMLDPGFERDWIDEEVRDAEERVEKAAAETGVEASGRVVIGTPQEALAELSRQVDVVVVGSRGWGPVRRTLIGSTASALLRSADSPVIVLPRGAATGEPGEGEAPASATGTSTSA